LGLRQGGEDKGEAEAEKKRPHGLMLRWNLLTTRRDFALKKGAGVIALGR
jgi:hypothetical protein